MPGVFAPGRRAVELHAGLDLRREEAALLEEHELRVVVAERVLGLEVQRRLEAGLLAGERFLDLGEQVVAAVEELDRLGQLVDRLPLRIFEPPGQG